MKSIDEVKLCCRIDEDDENGCWLWGAAVDRGSPKIWAPDHTAGGMRVQIGRRAVWHMVHGKALPAGWRVYADPSKCTNPMCVNPDHIKAGTSEQWAKDRADADVLKGNVRVLAHLRRMGRARSVLTPELHREIVTSHESGAAISRRTGLGKHVISRARRGRMTSFEPLSGMFSQLVKKDARA